MRESILRSSTDADLELALMDATNRDEPDRAASLRAEIEWRAGQQRNEDTP